VTDLIGKFYTLPPATPGSLKRIVLKSDDRFPHKNAKGAAGFIRAEELAFLCGEVDRLKSSQIIPLTGIVAALSFIIVRLDECCPLPFR